MLFMVYKQQKLITSEQRKSSEYLFLFGINNILYVA